MKLWIGGSSGLAQTYFNTFVTEKKRDTDADNDDESWILLGCEPTPPRWIIQLQQQQQQQNYHYIYCDLYKMDDREMQRVMDGIKMAVVKSSTIATSDKSNKNDSTSINSILVGIRPPLVTYRTNEAALRYNNSVVDGLYMLLQQLFQQYSKSMRLVLHISSIAAIDHIATQHLRSIAPTSSGSSTSSGSNSASLDSATTKTTKVITDPSYTELRYPYDRFKRQCEMMIEQLVEDVNHNNNQKIQCSSLRLGAIFSDTPNCIQCTALLLQFLFCGPYLPTHIDCNSSYNVSQLIHEIFASTSSSTSTNVRTLRPIYYYTRCVSQYPYPVPYGEYLISYQKAYRSSSIIYWWTPLLIPHVLIEYGVVRLLHAVTVFLQMLHYQYRTTIFPYLPPYIESIDYLLQVTLNEHTFDMKETIKDFPSILHLEETMEECFRRRRQQHQQRRRRQ
jgi:hypothetical protein